MVNDKDGRDGKEIAVVEIAGAKVRE